MMGSALKNNEKAGDSPGLLVYLSELSGCPRTSDIAEQIQKALEVRGCGKFQYSRRCTGVLECDKEGEVLKYTLFEDQKPVLDVIQFPYHIHLGANPSSAGSIPLFYILEMFLYALLWLVSVLILALPRTLGCFSICGFQPTFRLRDLTQILWVISAFWVAAIYMAALLWSVYEVSSGNIDDNLVAKITATTSISLVVLSFLMPTLWTQRLTETFQGFLMTMRYYIFSSRRHTVQSNFARFMKQVTHQEWEYSKISIVGYSLGAVLALDAVFPFQTDAVVEVVTPLVDNLITLGCPFHMVRMLLPWYFSNNRRIQEKEGFEWTNIFIPADTFGSNFHQSSCSLNGGNEAEANMDVNGNCIGKNGTETWRHPGTPTNIVYRRGLLGSSRCLDEIQLTVASLLGVSYYSHLLYVVFSDGLYLVFDDVVAGHVVESLFRCKPPPPPPTESKLKNEACSDGSEPEFGPFPASCNVNIDASA